MTDKTGMASPVTTQFYSHRYKAILFVVLSFVFVTEALAYNPMEWRRRKRWASNQRQAEKLITSHEEYEYSFCQQYNKEAEMEYMATCLEDRIDYLPVDIDTLKQNELPAALLSKKFYRDDLLQRLKKNISENLEKNYRALQNQMQCLRYYDANRRSNYCQNFIKGIINASDKYLPEMRKSLALMEGSTLDVTGGYIPRITAKIPVEDDIEHPHHETQLEELTEEEENQIRAENDLFLKNNEQDLLKTFKSNSADAKCIEEENGELKIGNGACQMSLSNKLQQQLSAKAKERQEQYKDQYHQITSSYPVLSYISVPRLEGTQRNKVMAIKEGLEKFLGEVGEQYEKWKNADDDDIEDLFQYPQYIEASLTSNDNRENQVGWEQIQCDALQDLHDEYGPGGNQELYRNLGIAAGALIGGGVCVFTGGLACAIGVGIISEAVSIGSDQLRLDAASDLYTSQVISEVAVEDAEDQRNFSVALAPLSFVGLKGASKVVDAPSSSRRLFSVGRAAQFSGDMKRLVMYKATTPVQNGRWMAKASSKQKGIFFDVENALMKKLNDTLGDKNVVTALTNLHKQVLDEEMAALLKKYPGVEVSKYSDFKSMRFSFDGLDPSLKEQFEKELKDVLAQTNARMNEIVKATPEFSHVAAKIPPGDWFKGGIGETADQAGLAARSARGIPGGITSFAEQKQAIASQLKSIEGVRPEIANFLSQKGAGLVEDGVPSLEVFEFLRKEGKLFSENPDTFISSFQKRFGANLSTEQAQKLTQYANDVDAFSPGLWLKERTVANLDDAELGGLSADFKGMGAKNIQQVAKDLASNPDDIEGTISALRSGEGIVTDHFNTAKESYDNLITAILKEDGIASKTLCSGDDCVSLPTQALPDLTKQKIMRSLASTDAPDAYRLSFIPPGVQKAERTQLAVHGELIEKKLRKTITGQTSDQLSPEVMKKVTFALDMPATLGSGKTKLMISTPPGQNFSAAQKEQLEQTYKRLASEMNKSIAEEAETKVQYEIGQVIWVTQ